MDKNALITGEETPLRFQQLDTVLSLSPPAMPRGPEAILILTPGRPPCLVHSPISPYLPDPKSPASRAAVTETA